ncbi:MAG: ABC transporter ATP-binding protein [Clostridiaceae bacterium]|nr:ABC transporter ATP-binding protein [Clostridiaceae bacterium]
MRNPSAPKTMSGGVAKPLSGKKKRAILLRLWTYLSRNKLLLFTALFLMLGGNILALMGPSLSGKAIDAIGTVPGMVNFPVVTRYVMMIIAFYAISSVMTYIMTIITVNISRNVIYQMRKDVFGRLSSLPVSFFDSRQTGDIISVISYDIDTVNASLSTDFLQICQSTITVLGALIMMIKISPMLVLVFTVTVPMSLIATRYITRMVRPLYRKRSAKLGELNGFVEEMINGQKTTKAYSVEDVMISRFDKKNDEAVEAYTTAEYQGVLTGTSVNFINNISLTLVSVFGSLLYLAGSIGLGDISSFVLYSRKFSGPINEAANILGELQSAFAAAERVFRLIDEAPEKPDSEDALVFKDIEGSVELKDISFGYNPERTIINDLNLSAPKGSLIAIVGPTGAGKTTIINLLMRFYDTLEGDITVDGQSIYSSTRDSLRRCYTMVLQDTWLFSGTIFENIAYGKENVTYEEVSAAAKAAHIHSYIKKLPKGYDTLLSDNGVNISKGQKQLLTIARAMLLDSKMLILDEATSNVDTRTEEAIQQAMRSLMKDKTCFVIAHRLSTIRNADNILVVNDGSIVEQGTHEQLMAKKGFYYNLYRSQFESY